MLDSLELLDDVSTELTEDISLEASLLELRLGSLELAEDISLETELDVSLLELKLTLEELSSFFLTHSQTVTESPASQSAAVAMEPVR